MRRKWRAETKVWHDPNVVGAGKRKAAPAAAAPAEPEEPANGRRRLAVRHDGARIVAGTGNGSGDPRQAERERLLERLLGAEGHLAISKAAHAYVTAGFEYPRLQQAWLQLLEHADEGTVMRAIAELGDILASESPVRRAVLDSRLRRLEELAEEDATRVAAANLRRTISQRWAPDSGPGVGSRQAVFED
ncbi:MAG: hypothetical protein IT373_28075 [Polyangiaceae bacterium]|nr:hypothetical protein [Polyangiaceae bacterium]